MCPQQLPIEKCAFGRAYNAQKMNAAATTKKHICTYFEQQAATVQTR